LNSKKRKQKERNEAKIAEKEERLRMKKKEENWSRAKRRDKKFGTDAPSGLMKGVKAAKRSSRDVKLGIKKAEPQEKKKKGKYTVHCIV
jgi:hypothetical protein